MKQYVAMLRTDIDDRDITEWILDEAGTDMAVKFIADTDERNKVIVSSGGPPLILLNDRGAAHKANVHLRQLNLKNV